MKALNILTSCIAVFITIPIWLFLVYQILVRVNASELMWFLFWVYVPFTLFVGVGRMAVLPKKEAA